MGKIDLNSIIYNESLSRVELFSCLEQEDIYSFYTGEPVVLNINICSPLREDNVPSFGYYYHRDGSGILMFYDFATKDTGDVVKFVSLLFNLNYGQALWKIAYDLNGPGTTVDIEKKSLNGSIMQITLSIKDTQNFLIKERLL